jgi:methanogenic corrinoid protein MtbC1
MGQYRIKAVSRLTGVRPELLRRWEKRYRLFKPQRAGNQYREFDDEDVRLLLYLRQQIDAGRSIGELAAEGRDLLLRKSTPATASAPQEHPDFTCLIDELLGYVQHLEKTRLEVRLLECTAQYPFATLLLQVFVPLMYRLGDLWAAGRLSMASEHFATMLLKQRLLTMLQGSAPGVPRPLLLCACPAGEWHELGLLTFAYTMQQEGWHVCYLGANLPVTEVLYASQHLQPALLALSLTHTTEASHCLEVVQEIDTVLAGTCPTLLGGQSIAAYHELFPTLRVHCCATLSAARLQVHQLDAALQRVRDGAPGLGNAVVDQ